MKLLKKIKLDSSYGAMVQRAVNYVLDDEKAFKVFLQDGRVEMHNNAVERMFRHLAMGRRNWIHTGSHLGAENIAFMFSLFESCKLNDINFGDYIEDILTRLMEGEQDFMSLIPCNYISNMQEVKSRNGRILAVVAEGDQQVKEIADNVLEVPRTLNALVPLLSVVPLQLLAYYVAVDKGLDVDMPRNLAKSVTVE